mgnify:CR=1 FL=1
MWLRQLTSQYLRGLRHVLLLRQRWQYQLPEWNRQVLWRLCEYNGDQSIRKRLHVVRKQNADLINRRISSEKFCSKDLLLFTCSRFSIMLWLCVQTLNILTHHQKKAQVSAALLVRGSIRSFWLFFFSVAQQATTPQRIHQPSIHSWFFFFVAQQRTQHVWRSTK